MSATVNFGLATGISGNPRVFGEQGAPLSYDTSVKVTNQGFVFGRIVASLDLIVPKTMQPPSGGGSPALVTLSDYKVDMMGVGKSGGISDPLTWDWDCLDKLNLYGNGLVGHTMQFMVNLANIPTWLGTITAATSSSPAMTGAHTDPPTDLLVYQDIVKKVVAHIMTKDCVKFLEIGNEPNGVKLFTTLGSSYVPSNASLAQQIAGNVKAYIDIFNHATTAIRTVDLDSKSQMKIGGPALGSADTQSQQFLTQVLSNASVASKIQFVSYHSYDGGVDSDATDFDVLSSLLVSSRLKPLPIFLTEWNHSTTQPINPLNNSDPKSVSYVGRRLTTLLEKGFAGAAFDKLDIAATGVTTTEVSSSGITTTKTTSGGSVVADLDGINPDGSFMTKVQTFRLMSVNLGLGSGISKLVTTTSSSPSLTAILAAVNSDETQVICLTNDTASNGATSLVISGLSRGRVYDVTQITTSPLDLVTSTQKLTSSLEAIGTLTLNITLPQHSVCGLKIELKPLATLVTRRPISGRH